LVNIKINFTSFTSVHRVTVLPPVLHTRLQPRDALTRRTNGQCLVPLNMKCSNVNRGTLDGELLIKFDILRTGPCIVKYSYNKTN